MNGRQMLSELNAKLATLEQKNIELEARVAEVKTASEAIAAKMVLMEAAAPIEVKL